MDNLDDFARWVLKFTPSLEDNQAFILYHHRNSPTLRKQYLTGQIVSALMVSSSVFFCFYLISTISPRADGPPSPEALFSFFFLAAFTAFIVFVFYPSSYKHKLMKNVEKLLNEQDVEYTPKECTISFSDNEIKSSSETGEGKIYWDSIDRVVIDGEYIYLYLNTANAIIIPKRAFTDDKQRNEFIDYVNENCTDPNKSAFA